MSTTSRVWLITGTSSGIGRRMVEFALEKGEQVVATLRKPSDVKDLQDRYPPTRLRIVKLDVTDASQIAQAFAEAKAAFGRVDVVFNNAGVGVVGDIEGTPESVARKLFDVNFWGMINVSKEAVRFFREENEPGVGGRVLVVGSCTGLSPAPAIGYYSAAKHALEGITQTFAKEIEPEWNIKFTILEPGFIATDLADKSEQTPVHPAYDRPTNPATAMRKFVVGHFDPKTAVGVSNLDRTVSRMFDVTRLDDPPIQLPLGQDSIGVIRAQLKRLSNNLDTYESWTEGIQEQ